jgi:hypothetical protein
MSSKDKDERIMDILEYIPIGASAACVAIYSVLDVFGYLSTEIASIILLFLVASVSLYIITSDRRSHAILIAQKNECVKMDGKLETLNVAVTNLRNEAMASTTVLHDQIQFYNELRVAVCGAKKEVLLVHFDPYSPIDNTEDARVQYFSETTDFMMKNGQVKQRRIIAITDKLKLEWTKKLIEDTKGMDNISLAYVNLEKMSQMRLDFDNLFLPTVTSCQIIDNNKVFLLNPSLNYVPRGTFKPCIFIENSEVVKVYREYYESIWAKITTDERYGCILKQGRNSTGYEQKLARIGERINAFSNGDIVGDNSSKNLVSVNANPTVS